MAKKAAPKKAVPKVGVPPSQSREELAEAEQVRNLAVRLAARLKQCEKKIDASLAGIDLTLQDLYSQRQEIHALERGLGIER